jgi:hypothetical protein
MFAGRMYATQFFTFVMYSVQTAYLYVVVQMLIEHLESHTAQVSVDVRIGIASALAAIIGIAAVSIGPALLEIFNSLLRHLRASVERSKCMVSVLVSYSNPFTNGMFAGGLAVVWISDPYDGRRGRAAFSGHAYQIDGRLCLFTS